MASPQSPTRSPSRWIQQNFWKRGHLDYQSNFPLLMFSIDVGYHDGYFRMDEDEGLKHTKWKEALELVSLYFADPQLVLSKYQHCLNLSPFNRSNFFQLRVHWPTV